MSALKKLNPWLKEINSQSQQTAVKNVDIAFNRFLIGIDLGIKDLVVCSNGVRFKNPKNTKKWAKYLAHFQKIQVRKTKDSQSRRKVNKKIARIHEKITNARKDTIYKMTTQLIKENNIIVSETLNVKGMLKITN